MKKKLSPFDKDTLKRIRDDQEFAEIFIEELMERPIPVQLSILRRLKGLSQVQLASRLRVKQAFLSKLESMRSDHLIGIYIRAAKILNGKLVILPNEAKISLPKKWPKGTKSV